MYIKHLIAVIKLNFLLQLRNPVVILLMACAPLILMPFLIPTYKSMLIVQGYAHASGAEQAVPGIALLFSFLAIQVIIQAFYDEHVWGTWTRLRSTAAPLSSIILGKTIVCFIIQTVQLIAVIAIGSAIYGYSPKGSWISLISIVLIFCAVLTALSVCLSLWIKSEKTALSIGNLLGMLMSGMGGALGSVNDFPDWAQHIAKISPVYWAMGAIRKISLDGTSVSDLSHQICMLGLYFIILVVLVVVRCVLKLDNRKTE